MTNPASHPGADSPPRTQLVSPLISASAGISWDDDNLKLPGGALTLANDTLLASAAGLSRGAEPAGV